MLGGSGEKIPWSSQIWKEVATQGRKKRGTRVYGFGEHEVAGILPAPRPDTSQGSPSTSRSSNASNSLDDDTVRRVLAENAQIIAENERIRRENERLQAAMLEFIETFRCDANLPPPSSQDG